VGFHSSHSGPVVADPADEGQLPAQGRSNRWSAAQRVGPSNTAREDVVDVVDRRQIVLVGQYQGSGTQRHRRRRWGENHLAATETSRLVIAMLRNLGQQLV
jgi:hypothetical protein